MPGLTFQSPFVLNHLDLLDENQNATQKLTSHFQKPGMLTRGRPYLQSMLSHKNTQRFSYDACIV